MSSSKGSPKIVKVDLQAQLLPKKPRRKVQRPVKRYLSPQKSSKAIQKDQTISQQSAPQQLKQSLVQSQVQKYDTNEFSFSQQSHSKVTKIQGSGYEILYRQRQSDTKSIQQQKINYMHMNMVLKIFELCGKRYQDQRINTDDLIGFSRGLSAELRKKYGSKNEQIILKKEGQLRELLKVVFYRKRELDISEVLYYLIDCGVCYEVLTRLVEIFPQEIRRI